MLQNEKLESPQPQRPLIVKLIIGALLAGGAGLFLFNRLRMVATPPKPLPVAVPQITTVTALGRLEPQGEVVKLSAPTSNQGSRVEQLLVKEGDVVRSGQVIAVMENRDRLLASMREAEKKVGVARAQLGRVKAGAKQGELTARRADITRLQAELAGDIRRQQAAIARLEAELDGDTATQQATINRLEAELLGQRQALKATVARTAAEKRNAQADVGRYESLYKEGVISSQEVDRRRLSAETSTQQLLESQATLTRTIATLEQQIREAKANRNKMIATQQQQINEARATLDRTIASTQQQIKEATATLEQTAEVRPTDIAAAQAEVESAMATVERIRSELALAYIRAPKNGRVLKINTRAGETVSNEGIVDFGETNQMYAVAEVYQSDIGKIRKGQKVQVTSDSLPQELQGIVDWIGYQVQRQNIINTDPSSNIDSRIIEVRIKLDQASSEQATRFTNLQVQTVIQL
ncbi:MAG: HlyD family efflux transporter periplasmic adaptor subunit [Calothrix sp. C42_A2020_038]|nr:HlyD family efflux transporter periplasmic adaptor subunit [Calothrix sp. C42_A2020_038]